MGDLYAKPQSSYSAAPPRQRFSKRLREDKWYLIFILPTVILLFLFSYMPIYGLAIGFQDYSIGKPLLALDGSVTWVGLKHFRDFIHSVFFKRTFINTIRLSVKMIVWGQWTPLAAALLLNEIRVIGYKKFSQTLFYIPYFVSVPIVVSIMTLIVTGSGPIAVVTEALGGKAMNLIMSAKHFDSLYIVSGVWQSFGYGSILYLAGIAGVDPALYEAVTIDGGNRFHKMWHITLPYLMPTFVILLILSTGSILNSSTEKIILMYNSSTMNRADVIGSYVYRIGLIDMKYSYTTAIGLFTNIINFTLVFGANRLSNKLTGYSLW